MFVHVKYVGYLKHVTCKGSETVEGDFTTLGDLVEYLNSVYGKSFQEIPKYIYRDGYSQLADRNLNMHLNSQDTIIVASPVGGG